MTWSLTTLCFSNEIKWCLNICWHSKAELWWCWRTDGVWQSNCLVEESRLWRGSNLFISSVYLVPGLQPNWSITCRHTKQKVKNEKWVILEFYMTHPNWIELPLTIIHVTHSHLFHYDFTIICIVCISSSMHPLFLFLQYWRMNHPVTDSWVGVVTQ